MTDRPGREGRQTTRSGTRSVTDPPRLPGIPPIRVRAKSLPPSVRDGMVDRRAILDRLAASRASFVSVSAPAGYGKTTLLIQAAAVERRPVAWVSLDAHDDDPATCVRLLAAALHRVRPIATKVFTALGTPGIGSWSALTLLATALEDHPALVLFVDAVDALAADGAMEVLDAVPDILPSGSRLVVASRRSPPFELSRRRVAGSVLELDRTNLAFDDLEAFELATGMGSGLGQAAASTLNEQAEGWPAALYLGLVAGTTDLPDAATAVSVTESRAIASYLRSEVLEPLGPDLVAFLRRTSFLDRLSGPLCDAVLERTGSASILAQLDHANGFVVPLDDQGRWYRVHHLLRALLRADLAADQTADVARLAASASVWFDELGFAEEAIDCARLTDDETRLTALLVAHTQIAFNTGNVTAVRRWLDEAETAPWLARHAELAVTGAIYFSMAGDARRAGQWMHLATAADANERMSDGSASIHAWLALGRAIMAQNGAASMLADAAIAVDQVPPLSQWRTAALGVLGIAHYLAGDERTADAMLEEADRASIPPAAATARALALAYRGVLAIERGDWARAATLAAAARDIVLRNALGEHAVMSIVFALAARVAMRRGNRTQAANDQAQAHRLRAGLSEAVPWLAVGANLELARVALAQSDAAGTRNLLAEASAILDRFPSFGRLASDVALLRAQAEQAASAVVGASALTSAELRLLPHLSTYLSFREIGERVGVSPNTIKSQTVSIYRKLDVSSRSEAIARAAAIGLTDPLGDPGIPQPRTRPAQELPGSSQAVMPPHVGDLGGGAGASAPAALD